MTVTPENIDRVQYLTRKAQMGQISATEKSELCQLLDVDENMYQGPGGLELLLVFALGAIIGALIIAALSSR